ncbi:hypothetical protein [Dyella psychrodurans]|uniref:Uncharacterized protein n=1 Tax=Dyella psychrodurans TaxID=1927960 RepID=A0A370XBR2_9GAMM|nr:hypothetical protein [Dyella psychrodurans]RDS85839.1 hypothetical protein DWU99_00765 [Dyella psychrodurans]
MSAPLTSVERALAAVRQRRERVRLMARARTSIPTIAAVLGTTPKTIRADLVALSITAPEIPVWPHGVVVGPTRSPAERDALLHDLHHGGANPDDVCAHFRISRSAYDTAVAAVPSTAGTWPRRSACSAIAPRGPNGGATAPTASPKRPERLGSRGITTRGVVPARSPVLPSSESG